MSLTMTQKVKIINSVTDENIFRKEVLIPLFRNKQKYLYVIDNHGIDEKGTDIVLIEQGEYGQFVYTAVIVKSKKLNRAATGSSTAANVMNQMEMASTAGFNCPIQKREVRFDWLMIATSQDISNEAQDFLNKKGGALHTSPIFLFGEQLAKQIDDFLPDFYFYTAAQFSQLATIMRKKCDKLYELQKITRYTGEARKILDVFVTPRFRHTIFKDKDKDEKEKKGTNVNLIKTLSETLETHTRILLVGGPGTGKSTAVREMLLKLQSQNTRDVRPSIPLLVRAADLAEQNKDDFINAFNQVICSEMEQSDFDLNNIANNADIYLFIDGLDEVTEQSKRARFTQSLDEFEKEYKHINIIITSRYTQDIHGNTITLPAFKRWHVLPFNTYQVRTFIEKWFGDVLQSSRLIKALQDHNLLSKLPNTPLVLTLLAILFSSDSYREIPSNLSELYQMFLDLLFGKWSLNRRVDTMYDAQIKQYVATELALELHQKNAVKLTVESFNKIVDESAKRIGQKVDAVILLEDFLNHSSLLIFEDDELQFTHLSFQEFLVAQHIVERSNTLTQQDLLSHYDSDWWDNVLYFYSGLRKQNPDLLPRLISKLPELSDLRRIQAILELGYIIQASYLTAIEVRSETLETALFEYFATIDRIKEITIDDQTFPEHIVFFSYVFLLSQRYVSRFLKSIYQDLFKKLSLDENVTDEIRFAILMLALLLAEIGDGTYLAQAHKELQFKSGQKLLISLSGMSSIILEQSNLEKSSITDENKRELKRMVKKINNKKSKKTYDIRKR